MLTLCPTPIGNLDDVTPRQLAALSNADIVACEDSRTTGKLFERLGIDRSDGTPRFVAYHEHNEERATPQLVDALLAGQHVVLVSDAGTPAISDPGYRLVRAAREANLDVEVLPGPVAAVIALAGSGLPTNRWLFEGFAPSKAGQRAKTLEAARASGATTIFYESPRRVGDFLAGVADVFGETHPVCVARELTKLHEEWRTGNARALSEELAEGTRGEVVVVVGPAEQLVHDDVDEWLSALVEAQIAPRDIKSIVARVSGLPKKEIFDRLERVKTSS